MANELDIKSLRQRIGWSQAMLAAYLGIDRSNVSRIEVKGRARGPTLKLLIRLSEAADRGDAAVNELLPASSEAAQ